MNSENFSYEHLINLLNVYLDELKWRDDLMWKQTYRWFYAALITIIIPFLDGIWDSLNIPEIRIKFIFPIAGIVISLLSLFIVFGYIKRAEASTDTYAKLLQYLPNDYRRIPIEKLKKGKLFKWRTPYVICPSVFIILIILAIFELFII